MIGSLFGVAGAGLSGFKMQKRVGDIEEFKFKSMRKPYSKYIFDKTHKRFLLLQ